MTNVKKFILELLKMKSFSSTKSYCLHLFFHFYFLFFIFSGFVNRREDHIKIISMKLLSPFDAGAAMYPEMAAFSTTNRNESL